MNNQVSRHLSTISTEIAAASSELARLRDRLETQRAVLDECRLRMLIAETPLADRELQRAADGYIEVEMEVHRAERQLETLTAEQSRLSKRLTSAGA
jgi:chromosome segregation ATPase